MRIALLCFLSVAVYAARADKNQFVDFWRMPRTCSLFESWREIKKSVDYELPAAKNKPVLWESSDLNYPLLIAVEAKPGKKTAEAAWLAYDGRWKWLKLPLDKNTTLKELKGLRVCSYPETRHFEVLIPESSSGVNSRGCDFVYLYLFDGVEFKFAAKKCD